VRTAARAWGVRDAADSLLGAPSVAPVHRATYCPKGHATAPFRVIQRRSPLCLDACNETHRVGALEACGPVRRSGVQESRLIMNTHKGGAVRAKHLMSIPRNATRCAARLLIWLCVAAATESNGLPGERRDLQLAPLEEHVRLLAGAVGRYEQATRPARSLELVIGIRG